MNLHIVIVTEKDIFYIFNVFPDEMNIFLLENILFNFQGLTSYGRTS